LRCSCRVAGTGCQEETFTSMDERAPADGVCPNVDRRRARTPAYGDASVRRAEPSCRVLPVPMLRARLGPAFSVVAEIIPELT
jgi:hypothetical protein